MKPTIKIGIDCGKKTGFAVAINNKLIVVTSLSFWGSIYQIIYFKNEAINKNYDFKVFIEDVRGNAVVFNAEEIYEETEGEHLNKLMALCAKAQHVGMVKDKTEQTIDFCIQNNIDYVGLVPKRNSKTKLSAEKFNKLYGWENQTNEHGRDAACLIMENN